MSRTTSSAVGIGGSSEPTAASPLERRIERASFALGRGTELDYLRTDMRDLSALGSGEFDIVFHQHSLVFVPDAARVIAEVARVLAPGGVYVFSTMHPVTFLFYESWTGTGWRPKKTYF